MNIIKFQWLKIIRLLTTADGTLACPVFLLGGQVILCPYETCYSCAFSRHPTRAAERYAPDTLCCIHQEQQSPASFLPDPSLSTSHNLPSEELSSSLTFNESLDRSLRNLTIFHGSSRPATVSSDTWNGSLWPTLRAPEVNLPNHKAASQLMKNCHRGVRPLHINVNFTIGLSCTYSQVSAEPSVCLKRALLYLAQFFFSPSDSSS
jgi:hypothetical protein